MFGLTSEQLKKNMTLFFVGMLLLFISFNLSFSFGSYELNIDATKIAGAIILIVASNKIKSESKTAEIIFWLTIGLLCFYALSFLTLLLNSNLEPLYNSLVLMESMQEFEPSIVNGVLEALEQSSGTLILTMVISLVLTEAPLLALIYFVSKLVLEVDANNHGYQEERLKKDSKKTVIFGIITNLLSLLLVFVTFDTLGAIRVQVVNNSIEIVNMEKLTSAASLISLSSISLLVIAIIYLVFHIRLLTDIYRVGKGIEEKTNDSIDSNIF